MGIMIVNEFEIRSYGWQELAVLYGPDLMGLLCTKQGTLTCKTRELGRQKTGLPDAEEGTFSHR